MASSQYRAEPPMHSHNTRNSGIHMKSEATRIRTVVHNISSLPDTVGFFAVSRETCLFSVRSVFMKWEDMPCSHATRSRGKIDMFGLWVCRSQPLLATTFRVVISRPREPRDVPNLIVFNLSMQICAKEDQQFISTLVLNFSFYLTCLEPGGMGLLKALMARSNFYQTTAIA